MIFGDQIDGLVQDCSNSISNALELLQSFTKPSINDVIQNGRRGLEKYRNISSGDIPVIFSHEY